MANARVQESTGRWLAVGRSADEDAGRAGAAAAGDALTGDDPRLLVVFASDHYDLAALLGGIRAVAGNVPLIGCSTAGEISASGPGDASVVVTALGGPGFSVATGVACAAERGLREAGADVADCLNRVDDRPHQILLLLADGLAGDQQEIVRAAYRVAGAGVPLVGGCAGDGLRMERTHQFHDDRVLTNCVVGAAIASDAPLGIGVRHGWRRAGAAMLVTGSEGSVVHSLDNRPALDVYLEASTPRPKPPTTRPPSPASP